MPANRSRTKLQGIHYTPPSLASFVAERTESMIGGAPRTIRVLDPACGEGELLRAIATRLHHSGHRAELVGCDSDPDAVHAASARLHFDTNDISVRLYNRDFLGWILSSVPSSAYPQASTAEPAILRSFDVVIANPPYVRTQVLGTAEAQRLSAAFGLRGRIDLYYAFVVALTESLRDQGVIGLITSNRFLTIRSGVRLREFLAEQYDLARVIDLGDTKLFRAAVLPALIFGRKSAGGSAEIPLVSVYEEQERQNSQQENQQQQREQEPAGGTPIRVGSLFAGLWDADDGVYAMGPRTYRISRGVRCRGDDAGRPWVATGEDDQWLRILEKNISARFENVGKIRVGIKTAADPVFVREDWASLDEKVRPEDELLLPLVTHESVARWSPITPIYRVLYPYDLSAPRRVPLDLDGYPRARAYLETHRTRLESRRYVVESGRYWWEIWVPQRPGAWSRPKLVFPDISEQPCFSLDTSHAVVNGDCYWVALDQHSTDLGMLMLGVANSTLAARFYDARCGNKLYAGRRRFITQYVSEFPLPDPGSRPARDIIETVRSIAGRALAPTPAVEEQLDRLVWRSFGFDEAIGWR
jgi:adenine-specific DNA-methyltransferase